MFFFFFLPFISTACKREADRSRSPEDEFMAVPEFRATLPPDRWPCERGCSPVLPLTPFHIVSSMRYIDSSRPIHARLIPLILPGSLLVPTPPAVSRFSSFHCPLFPSLIHRLCRRWKSRRLIFGWLMILICCFISAILFSATCLSVTKTRQDQFVVPFHPFSSPRGLACDAMRSDPAAIPRVLPFPSLDPLA